MSFRSVPTLRVIENSIKIVKKFKRLKNTIMASFQAKTAEKERIYKLSFRSVPFRSYPARNWKFQKNSNKIEKIKIYHYGFISSQNTLEKAEKERKQKLSLRFVSYPTRNLKFQKNCNKIPKNKIYHYGFISSQNRLEKAEKEKK